MRLILNLKCLSLMVLSTSMDYPQDVPISVDRLAEGVIRVRVADNPGATNVTALSSERGVVVIDTEMSYAIATELKKAISSQFGRNDFSYVINTHEHWDHTMGNQAFTGSVVVGHENAIEAMHAFDRGKADFATALQEGWIDWLEQELTTLESSSDSANALRRRILYSTMVRSELEEGFVSTPPSVTFRDRLTVNLGNMRLTLVHVGPAHTKSDIIVRVDPGGILVVGDVFSKNELPYIDSAGDVARFLGALNNVLDDSSGTTHVVPGHGEVMTAAELRVQRDYVKDLWDEVVTAREQGLTLEETKELLSFNTRFEHLLGLQHTWSDGTDFHMLNIENVWEQLGALST
jgi:glyoxylase-like metal-dependent hydrolase (beta-lactamase superfamily II)